MQGQFDIKKEMVLGFLKSIMVDKSHGPDRIYPRFMGEMREEIAGTKIIAINEVLLYLRVDKLVPLLRREVARIWEIISQ